MPERGISIATKIFAGNGSSQLDDPTGKLVRSLSEGIITKKPLVDRLPGFCPAVHPLDVSQWTAALGPVAKRNKRHVTQAGTLAASLFIVSH
jgi:hypothetical protein